MEMCFFFLILTTKYISRPLCRFFGSGGCYRQVFFLLTCNHHSILKSFAIYDTLQLFHLFYLSYSIVLIVLDIVGVFGTRHDFQTLRMACLITSIHNNVITHKHNTVRVIISCCVLEDQDLTMKGW